MPRATRKDRPVSRRSARDSRSSAGRRAAISGSTLAGRGPTGSVCNGSRGKSSSYSSTSFFPVTEVAADKQLGVVFMTTLKHLSWSTDVGTTIRGDHIVDLVVGN